MSNAEAKDEQKIVCPFCGSAETEFFSLFGQFLLASQYYCRDCRTVFDVVRWTEEPPPNPPPTAEAHRDRGGR